ncbi:MAG: succinate dehydrogenase, hydrophobic membrane anchor protein [Gammaproteobacteria bacterium]|jgi:succinate dehydrogenase / fumarate reductase membrane anchor subunit
MSSADSSGLRAWTVQRLSALYMALFSVYALISFLGRDANHYEQWVAWISHPVNNIATGVFILALLLHAWVGARDIVLDYVKPFSLRMVKLAGLMLFLIAMGLWALKVLLSVTSLS